MLISPRGVQGGEKNKSGTIAQANHIAVFSHHPLPVRCLVRQWEGLSDVISHMADDGQVDGRTWRNPLTSHLTRDIIGHMTDDGQVVGRASGDSLTSHMTRDIMSHVMGDGWTVGRVCGIP